MRMAPMVMVMFVIYISIGVYYATLGDNGLISGDPGSPLFNIIVQPDNWKGDSTFGIPNVLLAFGAIFAAFVGIATVVSFVSKSDLALLSPMFFFFVLAGTPAILSLYKFVTNDVGKFLCNVGEPCGPANLLGYLTAGILALYWIFTCIQWWTWRETT